MKKNVLVLGLISLLTSTVFAADDGHLKDISKDKKSQVFRVTFPIDDHRLDVDLPLQTTLEEMISRDQKPTDLRKD